MNTNTGELFNYSEMEDLSRKARREQERSQEKLEKLARFEEGVARGEVVPVSDDVAHTVRVGQREKDRRKRRRQAARQARRNNRR